jgi:hypothetical protein
MLAFADLSAAFVGLALRTNAVAYRRINVIALRMEAAAK